MMRKEDILLPVFIISPLILATFISNYLPENIRWVSSVLAFMGTISIMVVMEFYLKVKYSPYRLIKTIVVPWLEERQLLIEDIERESGEKDQNILYRVKLAEPIEHPRYGKVREIYIETPKHLDETLQFQPKKNALDIMGMVIDHPSVAYAIIYDIATTVDHAQPIPYFRLTPVDDPYKSLDITKEDIDAKIKLTRLEEENKRLRRLVNDYHRRLIRIEMENNQIREELKALLKTRADIMELAVHHIFQLKQLFGNILYYAEKMSHKRTTTLIGKYTVYLAIIGLLGIILYTHPEIISLIITNWVQSLIVFAVLGVVLSFIIKAMRR